MHTIRPLVRYGFEDMAFYALVISIEDPTSFQEAVNSQKKVDGRVLWQKK